MAITAFKLLNGANGNLPVCSGDPLTLNYFCSLSNETTPLQLALIYSSTNNGVTVTRSNPSTVKLVGTNNNFSDTIVLTVANQQQTTIIITAAITGSSMQEDLSAVVSVCKEAGVLSHLKILDTVLLPGFVSQNDARKPAASNAIRQIFRKAQFKKQNQ